MLHALRLRQIAKIVRGVDSARQYAHADLGSQYSSLDFRTEQERKPIRNFVPNAADSPAWTGESLFGKLGALEIETPSWGLRQLRHPVPRLSVAGRRADGLGANRRRRARSPAHGLLPVGRAPHPLGPRRRLARSSRLRRRAGDPDRRDQPEHVRRGRLPARQLLPPRRAGSRAGTRSLPRVRRDREPGRLDDDQPLARGRDELSRPGRPPRPARQARRRPREPRRKPAARDAPARRVQVLRAGLLQHRSARLGHGRRALPATRAASSGARRHRPPPAGDEHRADRGRAPRRRAARRFPLQQPQVRRRRPDRGRDRSIRAVPDPARARRSATGSAGSR